MSPHPYDDLVARQARRLLGVARATGALEREDLVAVGRAAVHEALQRYVPSGVDERTFVSFRVRQRMLDEVRRLSRHSRDELRKGPAPRSIVEVLDKDATTPSHEGLVDAKLVLDELLAASTPCERRVVELLLAGASGHDAAVHLSLSDGRVAQTWRSAVARLRRRLRAPRRAA